MTQQHISTIETYSTDPYAEPIYQPDGICHCDPQPDSSPVGECPRCRRLDLRKAFA